MLFPIFLATNVVLHTITYPILSACDSTYPGIKFLIHNDCVFVILLLQRNAPTPVAYTYQLLRHYPDRKMGKILRKIERS